MADSLKDHILEDIKTAMRAGDKNRLAALRLISAAIKQIEVDQRKSLQDTDIISLLDKMSKQRRDSIAQFEQAGRDDLVAKEQYELELIQTYLPEPLSDSELEKLIEQTIQSTDSNSIKDMGKLMGALKPLVSGRADMGKVSTIIKSKLAS